jgi:uncharacterized membrane protein
MVWKEKHTILLGLVVLGLIALFLFYDNTKNKEKNTDKQFWELILDLRIILTIFIGLICLILLLIDLMSTGE